MPMKLATLVLAALLAHAPAFAHEGEEKGVAIPDTGDILVQKDQALVQGGRVHILIHRDGHTTGRPHVLQLRPLCPGGGGDWKKIEPVESVSACELLPSTLRVDAAGETLTIEARKPDADRFNRESMTDPTAEVHCQKVTEKITLSLKGYCPGRSK